MLDTAEQKILIVDDDEAIARLVSDSLAAEGYTTLVQTNPQEALAEAKAKTPSLVILDIMMPQMDGYEFLKALRAFSVAPVIFLSAKDREADKVLAFGFGGDDYMEKPFKRRELIARVEAHLRRAEGRFSSAQTASPDDPGTLHSGALSLSPERYEVLYANKEIKLSPKEFMLLQTLMEASGKPVSTDALYKAVWKKEADEKSQNTVMVHMRYLRKKLEAHAAGENPIQTVWGIGYKIAP